MSDVLQELSCFYWVPVPTTCSKMSIRLRKEKRKL